MFDVQTVKIVDYEYILVQRKVRSYESGISHKYTMNSIKLKVNAWMMCNSKEKHMQIQSFGVFFAFWSQNVSVQTVDPFGLELAFRYLKVGDLEGAIFHQADSTIVPQDPLAVFLPLDTWGGVPHDVAV